MLDNAQRDAIRDYIVRRAESDPRIAAAALYGSFGRGLGDRWSDLDFAFGVADGASVSEVMDAWTFDLVDTLDATHLFDVRAGGMPYRVFLFPDWTEVDISFAPRAARPRGPTAWLFGPSKPAGNAPPPSAQDAFAQAAISARHAKVAIARGQSWRAEYCISGVRDYALTLACLRRDLPARHGKGFDKLPREIRERAGDTLVRSLESRELSRALAAAVAVLLQESEAVGDTFAKVKLQLTELAASSA